MVELEEERLSEWRGANGEWKSAIRASPFTSYFPPQAGFGMASIS